ncbi:MULTISPECIES: hypothetical protein [Yersinia]|nr:MULTISPECIES: hypothetical protein [Yersinia]
MNAKPIRTSRSVILADLVAVVIIAITVWRHFTPAAKQAVPKSREPACF